MADPAARHDSTEVPAHRGPRALPTGSCPSAGTSAGRGRAVPGARHRGAGVAAGPALRSAARRTSAHRRCPTSPASKASVSSRGDRLAPGTRVWFSTDAGMRPGDGSLDRGRRGARGRARWRCRRASRTPSAAALGLSAVAAWMALTSRGGLRAGERVLVLGAGGVVGQVAVQAAVALGASRSSPPLEARTRATERARTARRPPWTWHGPTSTVSSAPHAERRVRRRRRSRHRPRLW